MTNPNSLPSSYEALVAYERDRILSSPGFDTLTPELRHAVSLLCTSYLHKGATWAVASITDKGPDYILDNCVTVSLDLLSHIPHLKATSHD